MEKDNMKKLLTALLFVLTAGYIYSQAEILVDNFDSSVVQNRYLLINEGPPTVSSHSDNHTDFHEGTGSYNFHAVLGQHHDWGTYAEFQDAAPDSTYFDWSVSDSLSVWIKVYQPATQPQNMVFRIQLRDQLTPGGNVEQYVYENATTLDAATGWFNLRLSLKQIISDGSINPGDSGFVITPSSWGLARNNEKLDYDKIISYGFVAVTTANVTDSVKVGFDHLVRFGLKSIPAIIFNGMAIPGQLGNPWAWGQSTIGVETGAGPIPGTNALKWVQGNEWGNGWTGFGFNVVPPFNLAGSWQRDSVKFKLKCDDGVGALRMQFEGGTGKVGSVFTPIADGQWHSYSLALRDMVYQDGTTGFDSSQVGVVGLMAEASGIVGKVILITDWWTGNPSFDVIPPPAPSNLVVVPGTFTNLVTWTDVPGESKETYNIYYSTQPITSLTGVEVVKMGNAENSGVLDHLLRAPVTDQSVSYYYAVTCTDEAGNTGLPIATGTATTNTAKGVVTISLNAPTSTFNADGTLTEWAGIPFITMAPSGGGYVVTNTTITNDADLSVKAYLAVDQTYLYSAFNIEDDVLATTNPTSYQNDCPDLYIGLYNWHGVPHTSYKRGAEPDYHLRFAHNRILIDGIANSDSIIGIGVDYAWTPKFPTGYIVEARIPWTLLAAKGGDNVFVPVEGYRIPLDFAINDNDANATNEREGILTYSPYNEDQSWNNVSRWLYTWIGSLWNPVGVDDDENTLLTYSLAQNYPNPFNPATTINYTLEKPGLVTLKVYDLLGSLVTTLVNEEKSAGEHTVNFNAANLTSGLYFYQITSGDFNSVKKMMLVK
jgi:hypothetical protein